MSELYEVIDAAPRPNPAVDALWRQLESADQVRRVLTTDPIDFASLDRVLERLPPSAVISLLLDRLSESQSRTTRMGVFRRLAARGLPITPQVVERLRDPRWYVLRNMLALLNEIGSWPADFSALPYARHEQATVRREALGLAVRIPSERVAAICTALADADERALRIGINTARAHGLPEAAMPVVLARLDDAELSTDVVVALIRLIQRTANPAAIERLLGLVLHGRTLLRRAKLAAPSPEMLAALAALARSGSTDARVHEVLELARSSSERAVREAAGVSA